MISSITVQNHFYDVLPLVQFKSQDRMLTVNASIEENAFNLQVRSSASSSTVGFEFTKELAVELRDWLNRALAEDASDAY